MVAEYSSWKILRLVAQLELYGASAPREFWVMDADELAAMYNGIGPERWPRWARRAATWAFRYLEAPALVHDFEWATAPRTFWAFTRSNLRIAYNGLRCGQAVAGLVAGTLCELFGWVEFFHGRGLTVK